jgi:hypothetical protein
MAFDDEIEIDKLDFQANFKQFGAPFVLGKNVESDRYFTNNAKEMHIFAVDQALMNLNFDALQILPIVKLTQTANYFFRYGVMRRLNMLLSSFRNFQSIIMPDRAVPLTIEQTDEVCRDLNSIYINILGVLDNYAWVMVHQLGSEKTKKARPVSIGLFKSTLAEDCTLKPAIDALSSFCGWEGDIKDRRDPAAHRMPLYVPPAAYTPEEIAEVDRLDNLRFEALRAEDFKRVSDLRSDRTRVGKFVSVFLHDPGEKAIEIYPTLPQDIGQMVKIGRIVHTFLRNPTGARQGPAPTGE